MPLLGFTDPITVKFANTPNAAKSMIGLPLAPSYLPGIPTQQPSVLTTVPSLRQPMNRYRYAALLIYSSNVELVGNMIFYWLILILQKIFLFLLFQLFCLEKRMNDQNIGECMIYPSLQPHNP